jgi:hypothetical protein
MPKLPKGKGLYIWKLYDLPRPAVVDRCHEWGIGHLLVKFADGRADHATVDGVAQPSYLPAAKELVPLAHEAGIEVWGWPYLYLKGSGDDEARIQAGWFRECGFDGFVIDAEGECKNKAATARAYAAALRNELPDVPIALSSYWKPSLHGEFPWGEFDAICDFHMPQVYWCGADPVATLNTCLAEFARFGKPVVPTGLACESGDYQGTPQDMRRFADAAIGRGCAAYSFWYWEAMGAAQRAALPGLPVAATGGSAMPTIPTSEEVAQIARQAAEAHAHGERNVTIHSTEFDLATGGWCLRFVGRSHTAAARKNGAQISDLDFDRFPWFARYASEACHSLLRGGSGLYGAYGPTTSPVPGDVVCLSPGYTAPGHIGIFLGRGLFAENTSSTSRGPGTVISSLDDVASRIQGYARVLPPGETRELKVVYVAEEGQPGQVLECRPEIVDGVTRVDLVAAITPLGYTATYRPDMEQGPRVYVKKLTPPGGC